MCTAAEAKTLQRVYGRYNSFFRKVIPAKRVQKPVLWYTRLTVYGNPGRVVNGCAPGIPVLICGFGVVVCGEGLQWGFAEGAPARSGRGAESGYSKYTFGKRGHPLSQRGKAVSSVVTSGCPKRSEGGFPVGTRTNTAFRAEPSGRNEPSGPPPARTYPSRPAHPAERAGRRHRSSPRRARVRRLHAHRWRLRG